METAYQFRDGHILVAQYNNGIKIDEWHIDSYKLKDGEQWKTNENGEHYVVNGNGDVTVGMGGKIKNVSKTTPNIKSTTEYKDLIKAMNSMGSINEPYEEDGQLVISGTLGEKYVRENQGGGYDEPVFTYFSPNSDVISKIEETEKTFNKNKNGYKLKISAGSGTDAERPNEVDFIAYIDIPQKKEKSIPQKKENSVSKSKVKTQTVHINGNNWEFKTIKIKGSNKFSIVATSGKERRESSPCDEKDIEKNANTLMMNIAKGN